MPNIRSILVWVIGIFLCVSLLGFYLLRSFDNYDRRVVTITSDVYFVICNDSDALIEGVDQIVYMPTSSVADVPGGLATIDQFNVVDKRSIIGRLTRAEDQRSVAWYFWFDIKTKQAIVARSIDEMSDRERTLFKDHPLVNVKDWRNVLK